MACPAPLPQAPCVNQDVLREWGEVCQPQSRGFTMAPCAQAHSSLNRPRSRPAASLDPRGRGGWEGLWLGGG